MDAPEKIYVDSNAIGENVTTSVLRKQFDSPSCVEYIRKDAFIEKVYKWLKNYAFVDDNKNVNLPTLLHDFLKDSRNF